MGQIPRSTERISSSYWNTCKLIAVTVLCVYCVLQERYVMPSVCLSGCLLITSRENYWMYLPGRKNWLNFRSHPVRIRIHEFFEEFFNIARYDIFGKWFSHNFPYISGVSELIFMKILSQMYPWTAKSLWNFGGSPDLDADSADPGHILLGGRMRSLTALVDPCHHGQRCSAISE